MQQVDIHLNSSQQWIMILFIILSGSLIMVGMSLIYWPFKCVIFIFTGYYGIQLFLTYGLLKGKKAIKSIKQIADNGWLITMKNKTIVGNLQGDSTVNAYFCILRFSCIKTKKIYSCFLCNDSIDSNSYRRLLVQLRCQ